MQDVLLHLGQGFLTVFQPVNIFVLMIGLVLGLLVAVLPGLTLVMGVSWRCPSPTRWASRRRSSRRRPCT